MSEGQSSSFKNLRRMASKPSLRGLKNLFKQGDGYDRIPDVPDIPKGARAENVAPASAQPSTSAQESARPSQSHSDFDSVSAFVRRHNSTRMVGRLQQPKHESFVSEWDGNARTTSRIFGLDGDKNAGTKRYVISLGQGEYQVVQPADANHIVRDNMIGSQKIGIVGYNSDSAAVERAKAKMSETHASKNVDKAMGGFLAQPVASTSAQATASRPTPSSEQPSDFETVKAFVKNYNNSRLVRGNRPKLNEPVNSSDVTAWDRTAHDGQVTGLLVNGEAEKGGKRYILSTGKNTYQIIESKHAMFINRNTVGKKLDGVEAFDQHRYERHRAKEQTIQKAIGVGR